MAHSFRHLIALGACVLGVCGFARAQAQPPSSAGARATAVQRGGQEKNTATQGSFSVFARQRVTGLQFLPGDGQAPRDVEFFGNTRSPLYTYREGGKVPFYDAKELSVYWKALAENPRTPPVLPAAVAVAEVPAGVERALFLFIPVRAKAGTGVAGATTTAESGVRFNVYVVDDSPRRLPAGYASVINASGRDYMAKMGEQLLEVPQGVGGTVPVSGSVELRLAARTGGNWVVGGRHTFRLGEQERVSLVLFPPTSPTGIAPIIRTLIEELPAEPPGTRVASMGH